MKGVFCGILSAVTLLCTGAETVVFRSDFANNRDLTGWRDVFWSRTKKVDPARYKVVEEKNEVFYRVEKVKGQQLIFGLSHKLDKDIRIDNRIDRVVLEVTLRKRKGNSSYMAGAALSSRASLEGNRGQAFARGKDSGFQVTGNEYPTHYAGNFISWQKDGDSVKMHPQTKPGNFMLGLEMWLNWKLVYNHQTKELSFYRDGARDEKPFIVQRNVNLDGVVLQSVWLAGYSHEYKNVKVTVITK